MPVELKTLTYTSWARPGILQDDIDAIVSSARVNNPLDGITGVLIFNGSSFLQILEGSEAAVDNLVTVLRLDPRHSSLSVRREELIPVRNFPDWSMASLRLANGKFEGKEEVARALKRNLPSSLRNIILGMTHALRDSDSQL